MAVTRTSFPFVSVGLSEIQFSMRTPEASGKERKHNKKTGYKKFTKIRFFKSVTIILPVNVEFEKISNWKCYSEK
jgi:hypothetical protein